MESKALTKKPAGKLNKSRQALAIRRAGELAGDYVPHWGMDEVKALAFVAEGSRHGERDKLLVLTLFDACLRISEALGICPKDIDHTADGWRLRVLGEKGSGRTVVALSSSLSAQLQSFAYRKGITPEQRFFPISRIRAYQIISEATAGAGLIRPAGVGATHILRHSGAIERLRRTGNPKSVQDQLRHKSALMTLRYMKTLSHEESLKIQQEVDFNW